MRKKIIIIFLIVLVLSVIAITTFLVKQNQDNRQGAQEVTPTGATPTTTISGTCTALPQPNGVTVEFPACSNGTCDLTQASCTWDLDTKVSSYSITVTEVNTSLIIKNKVPVESSINLITFPINQGRTYKCDVVSVNACGELSLASTDQLLCEADALISTPTIAPTSPPSTPPQQPTSTVAPSNPPTPTTPPTATPTIAPTSTPQPIFLPTATNTPSPTINQPGGLAQTLGLIGLVALVLIGGVFLLIL